MENNVTFDDNFALDCVFGAFRFAFVEVETPLEDLLSVGGLDFDFDFVLDTDFTSCKVLLKRGLSIYCFFL